MIDWYLPGERMKISVLESTLRSTLLPREMPNLQNSTNVFAARDVAASDDAGSNDLVVPHHDPDPMQEQSHHENDSSSPTTVNCNFGENVLVWQLSPTGVAEDQRLSSGFAMRKTVIRWTPALQILDEKTPFDCWKFLLPWKYFFGDCDETECCLLWTNNSLPGNVKPFTVHEWLQFIGVLFMRTLHPHGPIRSLWGSDYDLASPPVDLGKRFGVSRFRFEQWRKHIKFAPPYAYITDNAFNCIRPLIHAFNANRLQTIRPGSELILDESMGKWIPVAEVCSHFILETCVTDFV